MLVSYNWLKEYVNITASPDELSHRLTMAGLEVSNLACVGEEFETILDDYYDEHGWDISKGVPNKGKLIELGLEDLTGMLEV